MQRHKNPHRDGRRGGSTIELALLSPWIIFLFIGAFDFGFYNYALISLQSAARVAALHTSTDSSVASDSAGACTYVLNELKSLPNVGSSMSSCTGVVTVTAAAVTGPDGANASQVTVTYTTVLLFPIPGVLKNQFTFQASQVMRLRS